MKSLTGIKIYKLAEEILFFFHLYCSWRPENTLNSRNICMGGDLWEKTERWFSKCRHPALLNGSRCFKKVRFESRSI